jgi:thioredoxin reductase
MAFERAALSRAWTQDLTVQTNAEFILEESERKRLLALGVKINEQRILELQKSSGSHHLEAIRFEDGQRIPFAAMFVAPGQQLRSSLAVALDCRISEVGPLGLPVIDTDPVTGETTTPGVYAAGDAATSPMQSLILAAASGARAAYFSNHALAIEDAARALDGSSMPAGHE